MKAIRDPQRLLAAGLADIRKQFDVPDSFPPEVLAAAETAAGRIPVDHADWTDRHFLTLDPASSTDLDQAFAIERSGSDILLHYAIADVAWFVTDGDPLDTEAWQRGTTTYLPDGRASLYPVELSEKAASLLPDGPRPAIVLSVLIAPDGTSRLDGATRALIRSRAKLAYGTVRDDQLPDGFAELGARIAAAEDRRGAARVDPPEQQLEPNGIGGFTLSFRPYSKAETGNAALSLAANLAVADAMLAGGTGLFRVMASPDSEAIEELRRTAAAFSMDWPQEMPLAQFEKRLDPGHPSDAAIMLAIRRAGRGATYRPHRDGHMPWHAAIAAPYAHATAPLRRLADRHVLRAVLAIANGQAVPDAVTEAFERLPRVMARAASRDGQIERAVIDLAESAMLANLTGETFKAVVTGMRRDKATIQLCDLPVVTRIEADSVLPGEHIQVRLTSARPEARAIVFEHTG